MITRRAQPTPLNLALSHRAKIPGGILRTPTAAFPASPKTPRHASVIFRDGPHIRFASSPVTTVQPVDRWIPNATRTGLWPGTVIDEEASLASFFDSRRLFDLHPRRLRVLLEALAQNGWMEHHEEERRMFDAAVQAVVSPDIQHRRRSCGDCVRISTDTSPASPNVPGARRLLISPAQVSPPHGFFQARRPSTSPMQVSSAHYYQKVQEMPVSSSEESVQQASKCTFDCERCYELFLKAHGHEVEESEVDRIIDAVQRAAKLLKGLPGAVAGVKRKFAEIRVDGEGDVFMRSPPGVRSQFQSRGGFGSEIGGNEYPQQGMTGALHAIIEEPEDERRRWDGGFAVEPVEDDGLVPFQQFRGRGRGRGRGGGRVRGRAGFRGRNNGEHHNHGGRGGNRFSNENRRGFNGGNNFNGNTGGFHGGNNHGGFNNNNGNQFSLNNGGNSGRGRGGWRGWGNVRGRGRGY